MKVNVLQPCLSGVREYAVGPDQEVPDEVALRFIPRGAMEPVKAKPEPETPKHRKEK
jgi:hypothetical protein